MAAAPFVVGLIAYISIGLVARPSLEEGAPLVPVILVLAAATSLGGLVLPRLAARSGSLRRTILVSGVAAMLVTGAAITVSSATMLLPAPEVRLLLILFLFGAGLGVVLELSIARSLSHDLRRLAGAVRCMAAGDYGARAELDRRDEIGDAARIIDRMAVELQSMDRERAEAQASRQAFLAAVGHDLRTPLAALRAAAEALEDGLAPEPARYYAAIRSDLDAMTGLVEDLFLLARIESGRAALSRVPVDLAELADEAVEALSPVARQRGVGIRLETSGHVITLGGPAELSRAMRNLLDNAIRHSPQGSEVVVEVRDVDSAMVRVVDQGPGFPDELRHRSFDAITRQGPFDGRTSGGAGLGLVIAQRLIEAHGGGIGVEPGPGGRIAFRVPRHETTADRRS